MNIDNMYTISNGLSVSRILLMIPVAYFLLNTGHFHREYAVFIILLAALTDLFDGYLARVLNQVSEFGKVIDPLADKIGAAIVVLTLAVNGDLDMWFVYIILSRDVIIFLAGMYVKQKTGIILPSTMTGKIAMGILALTLVVAVLQYESLQYMYTVLQWVTMVFVTLSLMVYGKRFFSTLRNHKQHSLK